jgi:hypothetical protein
VRKARIFLAITAFVFLKRFIRRSFEQLFSTLRDVAPIIDGVRTSLVRAINSSSSFFTIPFIPRKLRSTGVSSSFLRI